MANCNQKLKSIFEIRVDRAYIDGQIEQRWISDWQSCGAIFFCLYILFSKRYCGATFVPIWSLASHAATVTQHIYAWERMHGLVFAFKRRRCCQRNKLHRKTNCYGRYKMTKIKQRIFFSVAHSVRMAGKREKKWMRTNQNGKINWTHLIDSRAFFIYLFIYILFAVWKSLERFVEWAERERARQKDRHRIEYYAWCSICMYAC